MLSLLNEPVLGKRQKQTRLVSYSLLTASIVTNRFKLKSTQLKKRSGGATISESRNSCRSKIK